MAMTDWASITKQANALLGVKHEDQLLDCSYMSNYYRFIEIPSSNLRQTHDLTHEYNNAFDNIQAAESEQDYMKAVVKRYHLTPEGIASRKKANAKYYSTPEGLAKRKAYSQARDARLKLPAAPGELRCSEPECPTVIAYKGKCQKHYQKALRKELKAKNDKEKS
jgi:hypothetical protein